MESVESRAEAIIHPGHSESGQIRPSLFGVVTDANVRGPLSSMEQESLANRLSLIEFDVPEQQIDQDYPRKEGKAKEKISHAFFQ